MKRSLLIPLSKTRASFSREAIMSFSQILIKSGLDIEAQPPALGKKEADESKIGAKPLDSGPDKISQFFNFIIRFTNRCA